MPRRVSTDEVTAKGYLSASSLSKLVLAKRLRLAKKFLAAVDQDVDAKPLRYLVKDLMAPRIHQASKDQTIRLLAATCIAHVIRICAPDAPYSDKDLVSIFGTFIDLFAGLRHVGQPEYARVLELMEALDKVEAFVLLADLQDDDLIARLLNTFFECVSEEHFAQDVTRHMRHIMLTLLSNMETINQDMLDSILINLVEPRKSEFPHAYRLARFIVVDAQTILAQPISALLNDILTSSAVISDSALRDHVDDLLVELNLLTPAALMYVVPNLEQRLHYDDAEVRLRTVDTLGRMFAEKGSNMSEEYVHLWAAFLERFLDLDERIRQRMVEFVEPLMLNHPHTVLKMQENISRALMDKNDLVRRAAVDVVCLVCRCDETLIPIDLLRTVGGRMKDCNAKVRKAAMTGLAQLFADDARSSIDDKLEWIPAAILDCYLLAKPELQVDVERVLDNAVMGGKDVSVSARSHLLLRLIFIAEETTTALSKLVQSKRAFQRTFQQLLDVSCSKSLTKQDKQQAARLRAMVAQHLPGGPKVRDHLESLTRLARKSSRLHNALEQLASPLSPLSACRRAQDLVFKSVSAAVGRKLTRPLCTKLGNFVFNVDYLPVLYAGLQQYVDGDEDDGESPDPDSYRPVLAFLKSLAQQYPEMFTGCTEAMVDLLHAEDSLVVHQSTCILRHTAHLLFEADRTQAKRAEARLLHLAQEGDPGTASKAVQALIRLIPAKRRQNLTKLQKALQPCVQASHPRIATVMAAYAAVAKAAPDMLRDADELVEFVLHSLLPVKGLVGPLSRAGKRSRPWANALVKPGATLAGRFTDAARARISGARFLMRWMQHLVCDGTFTSDAARSAFTRCQDGLMRALEHAEASEEDSSAADVTPSKSPRGKPSPRRHRGTPSRADDDEAEYTPRKAVRRQARGSSAATTTTLDAAATRYAACVGLLKVWASHAGADRYVPPTTFEAWAVCAAFDPSDSNRDRFVSQLLGALNGGVNLPLRFMNVLVLFAGEPVRHIGAKARQALSVVVAARRKLHEQVASQENMSALIGRTLPEHSTPSLVHLLARRPDWEEDGGKSELYLKLYVKCVLLQYDSYTLLVRYFGKLKRLQDACEPDCSHRIHATCEEALSVLDEYKGALRQDSGSPAALLIPASLYRVPASGAIPSSPTSSRPGSRRATPASSKSRKPMSAAKRAALGLPRSRSPSPARRRRPARRSLLADVNAAVDHDDDQHSDATAASATSSSPVRRSSRRRGKRSRTAELVEQDSSEGNRLGTGSPSPSKRARATTRKSRRRRKNVVEVADDAGADEVEAEESSSEAAAPTPSPRRSTRRLAREASGSKSPAKKRAPRGRKAVPTRKQSRRSARIRS